MRSARPKVMHSLANKPLLTYALNTAQQLSPESIRVVVGHGAEQVKEHFADRPVVWCLQQEQRGTGHAVSIALGQTTDQIIADDDAVVVLYGDVPLISMQTIQPLLTGLAEHDLALLTATLKDPNGYGRILRDPNQRVCGIIEHKDASTEQREIDEINTGMLAARAGVLNSALERIDCDNAQQEYYLTDIVELCYQDGHSITSAQPGDLNEIEGVNSRAELARAESMYREMQANRCMTDGLTIVDPRRFDLRGELAFGMDCTVDVNVILNGQVTLGNNVYIHANCILSDCVLGDNTVIHPNTVLEDCTIGNEVNIGPFARIRPGTQLDDQVRIGNFVELKNSQLGVDSKVNHLSYVGDSTVGEQTNIGAGVITCNYDGANKHKTVIGNHAFIGSNAQLVAPVIVEDGATVAAGSTITMRVPQGNLGVARSKQRNISSWKRPTKDGKTK